jgi:hypothetical protein
MTTKDKRSTPFSGLAGRRRDVVKGIAKQEIFAQKLSRSTTSEAVTTGGILRRPAKAATSLSSK